MLLFPLKGFGLRSISFLCHRPTYSYVMNTPYTTFRNRYRPLQDDDIDSQRGGSGVRRKSKKVKSTRPKDDGTFVKRSATAGPKSRPRSGRV